MGWLRETLCAQFRASVCMCLSPPGKKCLKRDPSPGTSFCAPSFRSTACRLWRFPTRPISSTSALSPLGRSQQPFCGPCSPHSCMWPCGGGGGGGRGEESRPSGFPAALQSGNSPGVVTGAGALRREALLSPQPTEGALEPPACPRSQEGPWAPAIKMAQACSLRTERLLAPVTRIAWSRPHKW